MVEQQNPKPKRPARARADVIKPFRCKNLIAVIEDPHNPRNIGTVIRNVNALGVDNVYVVDPRRVLPDDWQGHALRKDFPLRGYEPYSLT